MEKILGFSLKLEILVSEVEMPWILSEPSQHEGFWLCPLVDVCSKFYYCMHFLLI